MLLIILLAMTSQGDETVSTGIWGWDYSFYIPLVSIVAVYFVLIIVEWFTNKIKLWKRKETK
jgi:hypothetical protein